MTLTTGAIPKERGESRRRSRDTKGPSENIMRELRTAFGMLDRNHDGRVYADDIHHMMECLGLDSKEENIKTFIRSAANGGHCIREHEFITWMEMTDRTQSTNSIIKNAFSTLDRDKDGYITKKDLREGLKLIGERVSEKALELMMSEADRDHDGKISYEDFSYMMKL